MRNNNDIIRKIMQRGLSLVEVLVASVVVIIIIVAAATVFPLGFKINEKTKQISSADNVAAGELEQITSFKYADIAPSPMPNPTPSPNVALVDTTGYTYNSQSFNLTDTRGTVSPFPVVSYPRKVNVKKLDSNGNVVGTTSYRVDLKIYTGKYDQLAYIPEEDAQYASINERTRQVVLGNLMTFLDPYAMAASCSASITTTPSLSQCVGQTYNFSVPACNTDGTGWIFGDGTSSTGSATAASHIYAAAGSYTVTFKYSNNKTSTAAINVNNATLPINVTIPPATSPADTGYVNTTNFSFSTIACPCCGADTIYRWNFGAGEGSDVTGLTANHVFVGTGPKTVTLVSQNPSANQTKIITIQGSSAAVAVSPLTGTTATTFSFTGSGTNIGSSPVYTWNFGDYTPTVTGQTSSHKFTQPGTYPVKLKITGGSNPEKTENVVVSSVSGKAASIDSITPNPANPEQAITFTGSSTGLTAPITYTWDFGDGQNVTEVVTTAGGTTTQPHTYIAGGNYTVKLTASSGSDVPFVTGNLLVNSTVSLGASPNNTQLSGGAATIYFTATAAGVPTGSTYAWDFKDGSTSNSGTTNTTSHTYSTAGTYNVTVSVTGGTNPSNTASVVINPAASVVGGGQSYMKKVYIKISPWSVGPPESYITTFVTFIPNNDKK